MKISFIVLGSKCGTTADVTGKGGTLRGQKKLKSRIRRWDLNPWKGGQSPPLSAARGNNPLLG